METVYVFALINDWDGKIRLTARANDRGAVEALCEKANAPESNGHIVEMTLEEYQRHP